MNEIRWYLAERRRGRFDGMQILSYADYNWNLLKSIDYGNIHAKINRRAGITFPPAYKTPVGKSIERHYRKTHGVKYYSALNPRKDLVVGTNFAIGQ